MSDWDLVLRGGRVIDPEPAWTRCGTWPSRAGRIAEIGTAGAQAAPAEIDVAGQVVTAGFIDLHSHVSDLGGLRLQALDGVTTALELEAGVTPVSAAYRRAAARGPAARLRLRRLLGTHPDRDGRWPSPDASLGAFLAHVAVPAWQGSAAAAQVAALLARLSADLADGAVGIGLLLGIARRPSRRSTCTSPRSRGTPACPPSPTRAT